MSKKITRIFPKKLKTFLKKFRKFNALNNLDKNMLEYINYEKGFYIECGANDGVDQSNSWFFEKEKNWKGLLIEPVPKLFKELKKNRSYKNIFINKFLVANNFKKQNVKLSDCDLLTSLGNRNNKCFDAQVTTLTRILDENNCPNIIDFFSIDVEGYELEVFKGIDFTRYNFKFILVETNNFSEIEKFLYDKKYIFKKKLSHHDYLFSYKMN